MKLLDNEVNVIIERKKIKNIYLRINDQGEVLVRVPLLTPKFEINRLISTNMDSLERMYKRYLKEKHNTETIHFLGNELQYAYDKKIHLENNRVAYGPSIEKINNFLEKNSLPVFQKRMNLYVVTYDNIPKFRLRTRKMKTRWGVCNVKTHKVTLNLELIKKDKIYLDYVIVHELSHLIHANHGKEFWKCVEDNFKDYKKIRKELKYEE